ncbi:hypothetical protein FHS56_001686 [Thermonema lapsum]|uniref:Uncharacterized protein n=1 Tax=Thermonema lapsum TaxID=28195 RepID=A0A846MRI9_9BACT|nr:hypothetical protein [Thermonema lapsum]NIK74173.1 hypothetical protein [Thermonema lapsum]
MNEIDAFLNRIRLVEKSTKLMLIKKSKSLKLRGNTRIFLIDESKYRECSKATQHERLLRVAMGMNEKEFFALLLKFEPRAKKSKHVEKKKTQTAGTGRKYALQGGAKIIYV